jgi:hypothetical protein
LSTFQPVDILNGLVHTERWTSPIKIFIMVRVNGLFIMARVNGLFTMVRFYGLFTMVRVNGLFTMVMFKGFDPF